MGRALFGGSRTCAPTIRKRLSARGSTLGLAGLDHCASAIPDHGGHPYRGAFANLLDGRGASGIRRRGWASVAFGKAHAGVTTVGFNDRTWLEPPATPGEASSRSGFIGPTSAIFSSR